MKQIHPPSPQCVVVLVLASIVLSITSCTGPVGAGDPASGKKTTIVFQFRDARHRQIAPQDCAITSYTVSAEGPENRAIQQETTSASLELELVPGSWSFTIQGYSSNQVLLARGSLACTLAPGERRINPVSLSALEGQGSLNLTWTIAGDLSGDCTVRGTLSNLAQPETVIPFSVLAGDRSLLLQNLAAGSYRLEASLFQVDERLCGIADSVLILANQISSGDLLFAPPTASFTLGFTSPDFTGAPVRLVPSVRHVGPQIPARFSAMHTGSAGLPGAAVPVPVPGDWYREGEPLAWDVASFSVCKDQVGTFRIDWIGATGGLAEQSATAQLSCVSGAALGPFLWAERLDAADFPSGTVPGLSDCRDLALSPSGAYLLAAGKTKTALTLFCLDGPGTILPMVSQENLQALGLGSPDHILNLENEYSWLVASETGGTIASFQYVPDNQQLTPVSLISDNQLKGLSSIIYQGTAQRVLVSVPDLNALYQIPLQGDKLGAPSPFADRSTPGLQDWSRPASMALNPEQAILAVGSLGDDGLYLFDIHSSETPVLIQHIPQEDFSTLGSFSDPIALTFSGDGQDLYILTYYGKTLFRLGYDTQNAVFVPRSGLRSGYNGVTGFDYPKRLALSSDNTWIAISGSGTTDGLSLVSVEADGNLLYRSTLRQGIDPGAIKKPVPVLFSPDSQTLFVGSREASSLLLYDAGL